MASRQYAAASFFLSFTTPISLTLSLGYSPLDFSVLDPHWGTIDDWVSFIDTVHARGMYIVLDFTVGTLSDLLGFDG